MINVPGADPGAAARAQRADLQTAFERVLASGRFLDGDELASFEREWAAFCAAPHALGVSSGTDALALALRACGVEPGDEVLVPAMTAIATWMAVAQIGAVPVGVDIGADGGIDPGQAAARVTPRTRALVPVHLCGQPADVEGCRAVAADAGLTLVFDAAQAHGARSGGRPIAAVGDATTFSFYPTKNLGSLGDAGAVVTAREDVADRVARLREYGWRTRNDSEMLGVNARMDELQAAFLRVKLRALAQDNRRRAAIAAAYLDGLRDVEGLALPAVRPGTDPAWHLFVVRHAERDRVLASLREAGVGAAIHYSPAPHLTSAFRSAGHRSGDFPVAEEWARTALSLPIHPMLDDGQVERVIAATVHATSR